MSTPTHTYYADGLLSRLPADPAGHPGAVEFHRAGSSSSHYEGLVRFVDHTGVFLQPYGSSQVRFFPWPQVVHLSLEHGVVETAISRTQSTNSVVPQ